MYFGSFNNIDRKSWNTRPNYFLVQTPSQKHQQVSFDNFGDIFAIINSLLKSANFFWKKIFFLDIIYPFAKKLFLIGTENHENIWKGIQQTI